MQTFKTASLVVEGRNGVLFVVIIGKDEQGNQAEMLIPLKGWPVAAEIVHRSAQGQAANPETGYSVAQSHPGAPFQVGAIDDQNILLRIRAGTPLEESLWFDRSDALALAESLTDEANRLPKSPVARN